MRIAVPLSEIVSPLFVTVLVGGIGALAAIAIGAWTRVQETRLAYKREVHRQEKWEKEHSARAAEAEWQRARQLDLQREDPAWVRAMDADPQARARASSEGGVLFEPLESSVAEMQFRFATLDLGIDDDESVRLTRFLPISVFVGSDDPSDFYALRDAIEQMLREFGFEIASELQLVRGSFFQKLTGKLRDPATKAELQRQAEIAQLALQQKTLGLTQAEINSRQAQAAAEVHRILDTHENYVIAFGSLVGVTHQEEDGSRRSAIVELTPAQLIEFQRAGGALNQAREAFKLISEMQPEAVSQQQRPELEADEIRGLPSPENPP